MRSVNPTDLERTYTCREYLDLVEELDGKWALYDGRLVDFRAMAGASDRHALITSNVIRHLGNALDDTPCRVYSSDLILRIPRTPNYRFGDATVVCGEIERDPDDATANKAVLNPRLIVEVASPTTREKDHVEKFGEYQTIASFEEYVLIDQHVPYVQTRRRQADGTWVMAFFHGVGDTVPLPSLGISLRTADIYKNVRFDAPIGVDGPVPVAT